MATIDPTTITTLRSRIEALTGADFETFFDVATALLGPDWEWARPVVPIRSPLARLLEAEAWTDFALALVARVLPGPKWFWEVALGTLASGKGPYWAELYEIDANKPPGEWRGWWGAGHEAAMYPGPTPALAILLALLNALEPRPNG